MLYEIVYQRLTDKYPVNVAFAREQDMEEYYDLWLADDDYHYCNFYYCSREYIPSWMK